MTEKTDTRELVRQRYAESARQFATADVSASSSCVGTSGCGSSPLEGNVNDDGTVVSGSGLYTAEEAASASAAVGASLSCIAGALAADDYRAALERAGWTDVEVRPTHRVHERAQAAIIRALRA